MIAHLRAPLTQWHGRQNNLGEGLFTRGRHIRADARRLRVTIANAELSLPADGDMRKRRDVRAHILEMQRLEQYSLPLSIRADRTRNIEQNDRKDDEECPTPK